MLIAQLQTLFAHVCEGSRGKFSQKHCLVGKNVYQRLTKIESNSYMHIVPTLWPHFLYLYWGRNDFESVLWPLEWRLISGWAFAQFLRLIRVLAVRMKKPSVLTYPSRNCAEFLREISRSFSANFRGEKPRRNKWSLFFSAIFFFFFCARGVPRRNAKRELFLGLICTIQNV